MQRVPDFIFERRAGGFFLPRSRFAPAPATKASANRPLDLLVLEDRVFYSATPLEPIDAPTEAQVDPLELAQQLDAIEHWTELLLTSADAAIVADAALPEPQEITTSKHGSVLIVIDQGIADHESLLQDIRNQFSGNYSVLQIESSADGWSQLNDYLAKQSGIEEVHLFSHGAAGRLQLGAAQVALDDLLNDEAAAIWQRALNPNAELLLYGCDIAADGTGIDFVNQFAEFSGAEVAASTDQTGSGPAGDWILEFATGSIETPNLWADGQDGEWEGLLATSFPLSGTQDFAANGRGSPRAVAMHSDGSFVMVWTDSAIDGQGNGIAGQRFDAHGNAIGGVFQVNNIPYATGDQTHATIDMDASGRFVVAWTGKDGNNEGIIARLFNANGTPVASAFVANAYEASSQLNPSVSMADDGRFVIAWQGNGTTDSAGVFARVFNSSGTAVSGDIQVNSIAGRAELNPVVSMNAGGNFAVSWEDGSGFHYQRFDNLGNKRGDAVLVDSSTTAGAGSILLNDNNSLVTVWQEQVSDGLWEIRYAGYSSLDATTIPNSIVHSNALFSQTDPSIAGSGDGDFVIAWQSGENWGDSDGIYHQAYDTSGNLTSYTLLTNDNYLTGIQEHASVAVNQLGNFVVVWSGQSATSLNDIGFDLTNQTPPDAVADANSATEAGGVNNGTPGQSSTGNVLANDTPLASISEFVVIGVAARITGPTDAGVGSLLAGSYGSLVLNADGEYTYTVDNSLATVQALRNSSTTLTDTFTYTIRDSGYFLSYDTLKITVLGANDAPIAAADSATAVEAGGLSNGTVGIDPTGNVLTNDTDPDTGDAKTVTGVAAGTQSSASGNVGAAVEGFYGSLTIAANGSFNYTINNLNANVQALCNSGQTLSEVFTYTFSDAAGLTSTSQITITIQGANDTPTVNALTSPTIAENSANGTVVTTATATEVDSSDSYSFSLSNDAGGRFAINSSTGVITVADSSQLNFETATSHSINIRVTDSTGAFSEQALIVNLSDVNEFPIGALSDSNALSNTVVENGANGTAVQITSSATDDDGSDVITYSLDDSASGRFAINSSTGIVTIAGALDFETATSHSITVRATSSDGSFSTANFTIAVTDFNEFAPTTPIDNDAAVNEVAENSAAGTLVGITAYSFDADGSNNTISYSLSDDAQGRFAINGSTGVVTLTSLSTNFEQATSHNITVLATSSDGSFTSQTFTINVLNGGNELNGLSDINAAADTLNENAALGSSVITAFSSHPDNLAITYTLVNDAAGRFAINSSTGVVTLASALNYEAGTSHLITIRADASDGSFETQGFTISVQDIDEFDVGTISDTNATANSIAENSANGTLSRITAFASDADGSTNTITYSLINNAGGRFTINTSTGVVTVASSALLNFEAATSHTITVRATSADSSFSTASFTIALTDVNEFSITAVTDSNATANSVAENATNGTTVGITAAASDADGTTNTVTYTLDDSAGGRFAINSSTGVVTVANGTLLDREAAASHTITVRATSADASSSTQSFTINLADVDEFDVGAVTDSKATANSVAENAANGTIVGITAAASDADATTNTITYSLDDSAVGRFAINSSTGEVSVASGSLLNFEAAASHTITVRATSSDGSISSQTFTIQVTNVNEGPAATNDTAVAVEAGGISNATPGTNPTGNVLANDTDPDSVDTKTVVGVAAGLPATSSGQVGQTILGQYGSLVIHSDGSYAYTLNNSNAAVQALRTAGDSLVDTFTYTMADAANLQSTARLSILITGVNDAPTAQWSEAGLSINAGTSNNQYVELSNFDQLIGNKNTFTMRLSISTTQSTFFLFSYATTGDDNEFRIYAYNGTLCFSMDNQNWDTGIDSSSIADGQRHEIAVVRNSGLAQLKVYVDGQLQAQHNSFKSFINAESGGTAILAQEQDSKGGQFNTAQYFQGTVWDLSFYDSAWTSNRIANETGRVETTAGDLRGYWNFDQLNGNQIAEMVAGRNGTLKSITGSGWIAGTAEIRQTDWLASVKEHPGNGYSIGTLKVADLDSSDTVSWSLSDNAGGRFAINSSTGEITVANSALVDRETSGSFQITAVAADLAGGTITRSYAVDIIDVDEFDVSPVTDGNTSSNEVAENAPNGTQVRLTATAFDADATNNEVTFTLADSAGGRFAINSSTGLVTVANGSMLNREISASHTITVRATSADGSSATETFTIAVTDIDEFDVSPVSDVNPTANEIAENAVFGTTVGITSSAADLDATNNAVTYSLDTSAGGRFAINSSTGIVTVANGSLLNYEAAASHSIIVRATSADGSFSTQTLTINVNDIDEFDVSPVSDSSPSPNSVAENAANGITVGIIGTASDADGTTNAITYSLDDDAGGRFSINISTGVVTVANGTLLDREAAPSHSVTIRATSADGSFSTATLAIEINNENEAPVAAADQGTASEAGGSGNSTGGSDATGNVLTNDLDPDSGDSLTVIGVQAGTNPPPSGPVGISITGTYGTLLLNANGSYIYTVNNAHPDVEALRSATDSLQDTFTYRMRDAGGLESACQLVLTITGTNDTPYAMSSETGLAINFEPANNQYVQVSDFGNLLAGGQFTLRLSISTTDTTGTFFSYATSSDHHELRLHLSNGKLRVYLDGQQWVTHIATGLIADGQRHELSVVRTVESGQIEVYLDGVLKDSNSNWKAGYYLDAGGSVVLGQDQDSIGGSFEPNEAFRGTFWDMSVYSTAWDATKLMLAGGQTLHSAPDLRGHWDFDLLGSNAILDLIGGRHGSLLSITPSPEWIAGNAELVQADWKPRIAENSVTGRVVSSLQAQDIDASESLTWSLRDDAGGRFAIDSSTGLLTVANGELLNFEHHQTHTVIVRVTDNGGLFREETYTIQLTDVQETGVSTPVDLDPAANRVTENASTGSSTGIQAWAVDEDGTTNEVTYSMLDNAGGRFTINSQNGIVSVLNGSLLDREQAASHQVAVRATSADGSFKDEFFAIQLIDIDEFDTDSIADLDIAPNTLAENTGTGSSVGIRANAVDSDATLSSINFSLDNDAGGRFAIDSQTGLVTIADAGLLDYETATSHTITVRATSEDGSSSITSFTILLTDVNEFTISPITDSDPFANLVFENSVAGTYAGITAFAQDLDATQNSISWRLTDDDGGRFSIDPVTGEIFTTQALDFESLGSVRRVRVEGSSADGSRTEQDFQIELSNVLTESFTVFSGLDVAMTPQELLQSSSDAGEQYQCLMITDLPTIGSLYVIGAQGKQAITVNELSQLAIPVGQKIVYEAPAAVSGSVTVAYAASTVSGQSRTGTVTIQVEPAMIVAPSAPPSSTFSSSSSSSSSSSGGSTSSSSSSSSSGESSSSQSTTTTAAESPQATASTGDGGASSGAAAAAVGPLPAAGSSAGSDTMAGEVADATSSRGEGGSSSSSDGREKGGEREQTSSRADAAQLVSLGGGQNTQSGGLQIANEAAAVTRVLASATSIQQQFLATAQFSDYLNKLNSALKETPLVVGFEMPAYATASASLFTVGYVAWLIRGGVLLTSFMSSIPSWQSFDPLPILENAGSGDDDLAGGNDTSIAELVDSDQPAPPSYASIG